MLARLFSARSRAVPLSPFVFLALGPLACACGGASAASGTSDGGSSATRDGGDAGAPPTDDAGDGTDGGVCTTSVAPSPGVVVTDRGAVKGTTESGAWAYLGIPYAAPPVGALRWAAPEAHACWSATLDASAFGGICPQVSSTDTSMVLGQEDCLTVNVWAPSSAGPTSALPTLVFIHGGGNVQGSSADKGTAGEYVYDGAALAAKEGVVVVTFNYRLGALGFLAHPAFGAHPGNYGILDQAFALGWVARNVAAFGGDTKRVLLFGQSAGAEDVCDMVASPLAKGLFSAALMESGACTAHAASDAQTFAQTWAGKAGCGSAADPASCLRALGVEAVTLVQPEPASVSTSTKNDYEPNVDGVALTDTPDQVILQGAHNRVPFVIGSNSDETSLELAEDHPKGMTEAEYEAAVLAYMGGDQAAANQVLAEYPATSYASPLQAFVQVSTDAKFTSSASYAACVAAKGQPGTPVWRYFYSHHLDDGTAAEKALGAWHGQELAFVFRDIGAGGYTPSAGELALGDAIDGAWAGFASSGAAPASPAWPEYVPATGPYVQLDDTITTGTGLRAPLVQFWNTLLHHTCP